MNFCKNPQCRKPIIDALDHCNQNCMDMHKEIVESKNRKFKTKFPKPSKALEDMKTPPMAKQLTNNPILNVEKAKFALEDKAHQNGLKWRMKQCLAVRILFANGWSKDEILREFRHNGMTEQTARKIIEDALC